MKGDFIEVLKGLNGEKILDMKGLFNLAEKGITRPNGWKVKRDKFILQLRHKYSTARMIHHRNKLPRKVVDSPSLDVIS